MAKKPTQIYQIKVTLDDTHPPIWRRILVPGSTTLLKLHDVLQIVMGWEDYHLHLFTAEIWLLCLPTCAITRPPAPNPPASCR